MKTRTLLAVAAASSMATASGAQILLALDFQGEIDPAGLSGVDPVTQAGFDAFEVSNISEVPDLNPTINPSFTNTGGVTFSITGTVGGFGTAGTGTDALDSDFLFLSTTLGYDDLVSWDVTGLAPNTEYEFTWFSGQEGGPDRVATITSGATFGDVQTDFPDLKLLLTSDGTGAISGTAERTGSSIEANLAGLLVQVPLPPPPMKDLEAGDLFGIDFGGGSPTDTPGNDWNESGGAAPLAAGSVQNLDGVVLNGVSVSFPIASEFNNDDGSDADYATALTGTDGIDPHFEESVVTDIAGIFSAGAGGIYTVIIEGLDDSLTYNITAVSAAEFAESISEDLTVNGDFGTTSSIVRGTIADPTFHRFEGISSVGGEITLDFEQDLGDGTNPIVNGILIEAVGDIVLDPADLDLDGDVDDADFALFFAAFSGPGVPTGNPAADLDGDTDTDDADFGLAFAAFTGPGAAANVPEPASLALLGLGGLLATRRRRP